MATCIRCGEIGKEICDTCLEKAKKGKLTFLFPLKNNEITTITNACKPKPVPAKVVVSTQTPQLSETIVEKTAPKTTAIKEGTISTQQVKNTSTAVAPVTKKNMVEESANSVNKQGTESQSVVNVKNTTSSTNEAQPTVTSTTTNKYGLDDDHIYVTAPSTSNGWAWWIVIAILAGIIISAILLPWNIGQWIVGIPVALLMVVCFLIFGFDACIDDEFVVLDVVLYVLTIVNIIFMNIWKTGYSTIGFVASIGLAVSSLFVMARAYYEMEAKQGHWALLCTAINVALIFWDKIYVYIEPIFTYIKGIF